MGQIVRANFTGRSDLQAFGPAFLYEEPEMFEEKLEIPAFTNYGIRHEYKSSNKEEDDDDDDEGYDPTDICLECGKNLRGEEECKRCYPDTNYEENTVYEEDLELASHNTFECAYTQEEKNHTDEKLNHIIEKFNSNNKLMSTDFDDLWNKVNTLEQKAITQKDVDIINDETDVLVADMKKEIQIEEREKQME